MPLNLSKYIPILILTALVGCKGEVPPFDLVEQDPKVVLEFNVVNQGEEIGIGDDFVDEKQWQLNLSTLKMYLSDIALIEGGELTELADVELVDLAGSGSVPGFSSSYTYIIPKGNYDQLRMSIGLPSDLNSTDPTIMPASDPLSLQSAMYWDWATMYVFIMMEARIDTNSDLQYDDNIAFHTGLDTLFRPEKSYPLTLDIPAFAKDTLHIDIDWNKIYHPMEGEIIDLSETPFFHANLDEEALATSRNFTDNFVKAISIREQ
jgi:hypothetical protein